MLVPGSLLISVNINRKRSPAISVIVENFCHLFARAHLVVIFSVQETKSWNPELELPGYVCYGSNSGLATLILSDLFFTIERSWKFEERWTAFLFKSVLVMAVYAPNCKKEFDGHERFKKKSHQCLTRRTSSWSH